MFYWDIIFLSKITLMSTKGSQINSNLFVKISLVSINLVWLLKKKNWKYNAQISNTENLPFYCFAKLKVPSLPSLFTGELKGGKNPAPLSLAAARSAFEPQGPRSYWEWNVSTESSFLSYLGQQLCGFSGTLNIILKD